MSIYAITDFAALHGPAAAGDAMAQFSLAYGAVTQKAGAPSADEGERWLNAACAQDFPEALLFHAALKARGVGRERDLDGAFALLKRAAAQGSESARGQLRVLGGETLDRGPWKAPIQLDQAAQSPRIYVVAGFIPAHVCDWLVAAASAKGMTPAVVHTPDGRRGVNPDRTNSMSGFVQTEGDLVVQLVSRRIARATATPLAHHEPMTVFKYGPGQEYRPHYDSHAPGTPLSARYAEELAAIGMRMATVLVYLNEEYEGGETEFPRLNWRFKGKKGDALIFWSVSESGEPERNSLHAGKPVLSGEKWLLSQWIRQKPFPLS